MYLMITDMTVGKPSAVLWRYSLPMLLSIVFQQFYNIADSIIAGNFCGQDALAAIGASYPVTMIFMAFATGINIGCSVVISQLFGGKRFAELKTAVSTSFAATIVLSVLLTLFGVIFTDPMMQLLNTPDDIFSDGSLYLSIYIWGLLFLFLYNICNGIFSALGDSKTPLYFLIASSLGNIVLDLLAVGVLNMGVAGVAWATFAAQGAASIFAIITLLKRIKKIETNETPKRFSWHMLGTISRIAVPSILQQSFVSVGNLFIQGLVNSFGSAVIAGYSAAIKLNTFAITSFSTMSNGISNFTAQNIGAGKLDRVSKGFRAGVIMAACIVVPFTLLYIVFSSSFIQLFMSDATPDSIEAGVHFLIIVCPFYFAVAAKLMADGVLRGSGSMLCFMATTFTDLILRVILAYIFAWLMNSADGIWLSWPVGWFISGVMSMIFYCTGCWKRKLQ